ncbi:unnamed protein product [Allacma fusca]|uniref:Uncharacterized protein n=1 Tax=Allacma fusca TaxID=39272 RepID=A0A8J2L1C4_9HEXA|nr:unnamed protein product [Allacma fusca]
MGLQRLLRKLGRLRRIKIIIVLGALILALVLIVRWNKSILNGVVEVPILVKENQVIDLYSVNTPACKIPNLQLVYPGIKSIIPRSPSCRKARDVASIKDDDQVVILGERFMDKAHNCTVSEIFGSGTEIRFSKPEPIDDSLDVSEKELIVTRCGNYYSLDANFPLNQQLQEKLDKWDSLDEIPFSVMLIGLSNYSRTNFQKNIPKSVKSMLDIMEFIEFQGYHSVAPFPLENFLGILGGMNIPTVFKKCHPNQKSWFDDCSLIWDSFKENDYVTMLMEDGSDTFTWDGMKGFLKKPTDFYTHPLFQSRAQLRQEFPIKGLSDKCLSRLNPQAFLFEYAQRFYKKFIDYPFFAFIWSSYMTHSKSRFTSGTDDGFSKLLYTLRYFPETLERTVVIIASDRGSDAEGPTGFLEKSLPGLFIRIPESLEKKFPNLQLRETLAVNSKRLVTGLDIHHTLQHLLVLNEMSFSGGMSENGDMLGKINSKNFKPTLKDRSSLLVPISESRQCSDVNIPESSCACNASDDMPAWNNPLSRVLMIDFVVKELNDIIKDSVYKNKCLQYFPAKNPKIYTDIVKAEKNFTEGSLTFVVEPERRKFIVTLRVIHATSNLDRFERLSKFSRAGSGVREDWCLEEIEDEVVKQLCTC